MGRIVTQVRVENAIRPEYYIELSAMVDTGATYLTLPKIWAPKLGEFPGKEIVEMTTATQQVVEAELCGPVRILIGGFRPVYTEVLFIDMEPERDNGVDHYEPLLGYIPLESCGAAVDMLGHRLVPVKYMDLK